MPAKPQFERDTTVDVATTEAVAVATRTLPSSKNRVRLSSEYAARWVLSCILLDTLKLTPYVRRDYLEIFAVTITVMRNYASL